MSLARTLRKLAAVEVARHRSRAASIGGYVPGEAASALFTLVHGLMLDGLWNALYEVGIFTGIGNLNGCLAKLKVAPGAPATLTNFNFTSADVSTGGLIGDGASKRLDTGIIPAAIGSQFSWSLGVVSVSDYTNYATPTRVAIGCQNGSGTTGIRSQIYLQSGVRVFTAHIGTSNSQVTNASMASTVGSFIVSRTSANAISGFVNGQLIGSNSATESSVFPTVYPISVFSNNGFTGIVSDFWGGKLALYFVGKGLSDAASTRVSNRLNAYARRFGVNTY